MPLRRHPAIIDSKTTDAPPAACRGASGVMTPEYPLVFGLSPQVFLLLDALVAIILLIVLITRWRVHPFIALTLAAGFLGITSGMPIEKVVKSFQDGFGGVLGFVGIVLGLGTMLGKMMAESGGADRIARTLIDAFGRERVHWAMMLAAFLTGLPLFFEIGFVLLVPLVFIVARRTGLPLVRIGVPLLAGLSVVHAPVSYTHLTLPTKRIV